MRSALVALALALAAGLVLAAEPTPLEAAVLAHLGEGRRAAARGLVSDAMQRQRPGSSAARRMALLGAAIDASEVVAGERDPAPVVSALDLLARRVEPGDLPLIDAAARAIGPARGYLDPARRAAWLAIRAADPAAPSSGLDPAALRALARDGDPRARTRAVAALAEWALRLRAEVSEGGALDGERQAELADPALLEVLVARLADRPGEGATDPIPAELLARSPGSATAFHALVACEAAAQPFLEARRERPGVREVLAAIEEAAAARLRRWPGSTWCSAQGEPPVVPARDACPPPCGAPLAAGARFCNACGRVARAPCHTCGALGSASAEHCSACGASAGPAPLACAACTASLRAADLFCPQCGARSVTPGTTGSRRP